MDQIPLEKKEDIHNCKICTQTFKSKAGLQYHMQKIHPLDLTSGLSCFTCNKTFTQRDLIENHYRTVRHQIECRKYMEEERVERTSRNYQKNLMKMNNFRYRPNIEKITEFRSTPVEIPLESSTVLPDPRLEKTKKYKRKNSEDAAGITPQKIPEKYLEKDLTVSTEIEDISSPIKEDNTSETNKDIAHEISKESESSHLKTRKLHQENTANQRNNVQEENQDRSTLNSPIKLKNGLLNECITEKPESNASDVKPTENDERSKIPLNPPNSPPENINNIPGIEDNATAFEDEVQIHLSASDENLFNPDLDQFIEQYLPTETRTVNLNNEWTITDTIGNPDFPQLLQEDPNFDLLTFITEKITFLNSISFSALK